MNEDMVVKQNKKDGFETFVKVALIVVAAGSILAAIKCIFVGLQRDEEYALTMSYRLLIGDKLLTQVWDPHQTSAFLLSLIEWVFIKVTGGTTYLVLWCKIIGTLIHAAIAVSLYKTIKLYAPKNISFILGLVYFGILPKDGVIPEFSIMMAWFITLIVISLIRINYLSRSTSAADDNHGESYSKKSKNKIIFLSVFLAFCSFGLMLSYPTSIIIIPFIYAFLIIDRKKNPGAVLVIYPVVILVLGLAYLGYLLSYMTPDVFLMNVKEALKACGSHDYEEMSKGALMFVSGVAFVIISAIAAVVSLIICVFFNAFQKRKTGKNAETNENFQNNNDAIEVKTKPTFEMVLMTAVILGSFAQIFFSIFRIFEYMYSYELAYYFWIIILAVAVLIKHRKEETGRLLLRFVIINLLGFVSVIALTNLTIFTSIPYCISGVVISLLAIFLHADKKSEKLRKLAVITILAVALSNNFFKGFTYSSNDGYNWNILSANKLIHKGAAKGIITEYMTGYINEKAQDDWDKHIQDGDSVLVWDITSVYYFNKDVNIASYTTISTPTYYVDSLEKYWAENPDKYPDVIAVAVWFGNDYRMKDYDHFLDWIENEYQADEVAEEDYYRYYIRRR